MKAAVCLLFACVLTASVVQAQAPAPAQGGQKIPLSEGLRRSYNTVKMNLTETAQKFGEVGNLPPLLAAWSANVLFAIAAIYMFLHVET